INTDFSKWYTANSRFSANHYRSIRVDRLLSALSASCVCSRPLQQNLEGPGGGGEGEGAGDVGGGAEAGAAVELERGVPVQVRAHAADAAVGLRVLHVLQRVHRRHAEVAVAVLRKVELPAQLLADQRQHRVVLGARQVADPHLGRVGAPAGRADGHDRLLAPATPGDRLDLGAEAVA